MSTFSLRDIFMHAKDVRFTLSEKNTVRQNLIAFMRMRPIRTAGPIRYGRKRSLPHLRRLFAFNPVTIALLFVFALTAGGSISFAAEKATPGDLLYPVKVGVNEEVRAAVAFSREEKVAWELRRLERRLEEAEQLAARAEGEADAKAFARLETNFEEHAERVRDRIAFLESKGDVHAAAEFSSNFETSLRAHERILSKLRERDEGGAGVVGVLLEKVDAEGNIAGSTRAKAEMRLLGEANTEAKAAAEGRRHSAENTIAEVEKFIAKWKDRLGVEATVQAESRLGEARAVFAQGESKLETGSANEAFLFFQRAHRIAHEAQLLVQARTALDLNIEIGDDADNHDLKSDQEDVEDGEDADDEDEQPVHNGNSDSQNHGSSVEEGAQVETRGSDAEIDVHADTGFRFHFPLLFR